MPNPSYPLIKSPVLRRTVEILAAALLIAFIVLALVASEAVAMVALGAFLIVRCKRHPARFIAKITALARAQSRACRHVFCGGFVARSGSSPITAPLA